MEGQLKRPPSLYIHDPYGRGQMVRLGTPVVISNATLTFDCAPQRTAPMFPTISIEGATAELTIPECRPSSRRVNNNLSPLGNITNTSFSRQNSSNSRNSSPSPSASGSSPSGSSAARSPKPRKNHSAGLSGRHGEPVPVCLDYLKGVCNRKRWRCKFAHPTLTLDSLDVPNAPISPAAVSAGSPAGSPRVCEVWALTGFCKFGPRCRDYHPPVAEPITKVCAPATTLRMTSASREAARRLSEHSGSECESPIPLEDETSAVPSWHEARRVLEGLRWENADAALGDLFQLLNAPNNGLTDDQFLPLLFGMAIDDPKPRAALFASICARLARVLAEERQHEFRLHLVRLAESVLHADTEDLETFHQRELMAHRKRGTAQFIGELFRERLIPIVRLQSALDYCARRASEQTEEGALHAELGCLLLEAVGKTEALDLQRTMKRLNAAANMHGVRTTQQAGIPPPFFA